MQVLRTIVVARYGSCEGGEITLAGRQQITALAEALKTRVLGKCRVAALLAAPDPEAKQSAERLGTELGLQPTEFKGLEDLGAGMTPEQARQILGEIMGRSQRCEVIMLLAHAAIVNQFPTYWGRTRGHRRIATAVNTPDGTARVINVETGTVESLPRR